MTATTYGCEVCGKQHQQTYWIVSKHALCESCKREADHVIDAWVQMKLKRRGNINRTHGATMADMAKWVYYTSKDKVK